MNVEGFGFSVGVWDGFGAEASFWGFNVRTSGEGFGDRINFGFSVAEFRVHSAAAKPLIVLNENVGRRWILGWATTLQ